MCDNAFVTHLNKILTYCAIAFVVVLAFFPQRSMAQIPRQISYQGLLVSPGGNPISDGVHVIKVSIFDQPTGGTQLYSESITATTDKGLFNVIIGGQGAISSSLDFNDQYWLAVAIDGGADMAPRTAFTAAPYALHAQIADRANSVSADARGVVTSINEVDGPIRIIGDSTTSVIQTGRVITISANPQGIRTIQNTDGTISITQPRGPTVTLNITDTSISTRTLARGAVITEKIGDTAVTSDKLNRMGAISGQVLKWNGTRWLPAIDDTTALKAGTGIVITTNALGENIISSVLIGLPPGIQGQTLRHDGTNWVATSNLYNDGNRIGIGTVNPGARLDVGGNLLLSNTGTASELRFAEPIGNGTNITSFKAAIQSTDIQYTLPPQLATTDAILSTDPTGQLTWQNILPPTVTVPFSQITSGVNTNQNLQVGNNSRLNTTGNGVIDANALHGSTVGGNSYAGRVAIPKGMTSITVSLPATVGCTPNSSVTISQFDSQGSNILVATMVTDIATNNFTVQFSASYPTDSGFLTYIVINP